MRGIKLLQPSVRVAETQSRQSTRILAGDARLLVPGCAGVLVRVSYRKLFSLQGLLALVWVVKRHSIGW